VALMGALSYILLVGEVKRIAEPEERRNGLRARVTSQSK